MKKRTSTNLARVLQDDEAHALLAEFPGVIPAPHGVPGPILARMDLSNLDCNRTAAVAAGRRFRCRCWAQCPDVCRRPGSSAAHLRPGGIVAFQEVEWSITERVVGMPSVAHLEPIAHSGITDLRTDVWLGYTICPARRATNRRGKKRDSCASRALE